MKMWSRGLGRVELAVDLRKTEIIYHNKKLYVVGKTEPPASWEFVITIDAAEVWRLVGVILNKKGLNLIVENIKMEISNRKGLKARYNEATKTRTGLTPQQEYAFVFQKMKGKPFELRQQA